jgi:predicted DNA-binding protein (UPF0251 family)/predicted Fe-Mo cluster-binding NifX family protein
MGRQKIQRECSFKPEYTLFEPAQRKAQGEIELNADEMEALYLMDYEGLYQESAALEMGISRPTFSRIIKAARKKVITALVRGYRLEIIDQKDKFIVAIGIFDENDLSKHSMLAPKIALVHLANQKVQNVEVLSNPLYEKKCNKSLTQFLKSRGVSYLLGNKIDDELKNSLLSKGVFFKKIPPLRSFEDIPLHICKTL